MKNRVEFFSERVDFNNCTSLTIKISGDGIDWRNVAEFEDGSDLDLIAETFESLAKTIRERAIKL